MDDRIVPLLQQAEALKNELDSLRPLDKEREAIVLQKLRLDWNFHSNHLEGNSLTFGETKALILFGITAQGKPLQDHIEITGHDEVIKCIEDVVHKKEPLTEYFIRQLHTLLLKEPYEVDAITPDGQPTKKLIKVGEYKTTPNHVKTKTGEIFRFATPEETPAKMFDLLEWYREKETDKETNPILFAADFHYKFIRIHPFDDGNGRMARILMNFILMQYGYPPVIIKTGEKAPYIAALEQADAGIFEPFIEFIITNETRSLELMLKGASGESVEEPDDLDKELALLEQRFKAKGKKADKYKNEDTIKIFKEKVYPQIVIALKNFTEKFREFYLNIAIQTFLISERNENKVLKNWEYIEDSIFPVYEKIYFTLNFKDFRFDGFSKTDYETHLLIDLDNIKYNLSFSDTIGNKDLKILDKLYSEDLIMDDINFIVKILSQPLTNYLNTLLEK